MGWRDVSVGERSPVLAFHLSARSGADIGSTL